VILGGYDTCVQRFRIGIAQACCQKAVVIILRALEF
jgi:hypothetical protein